MFKRSLFACLVLLIIFGCSTKVDINAPYKDIPVIYGLLDPNDSVQYIRVQKAYLAESDANAAAEVADSIYYPSGVIDVKLEDLSNNSTFTLTETNEPKDTGAFSNAKNPIFETNHAINPNHDYKLIVTNNKTGKIVTGKTAIVHDATLSQLQFLVYPLAGYTVGQPITYYARTVGLNFGENGYRSTCYLRLVWYDVMSNNDTLQKHLDVNLGTVDVEETNHSFSFNAQTIFEDLKKEIPNDPNVVKRLLSYDPQNPLGGIQFVFYTGSEDLRTYMDLNKPSTSINQNKPQFTDLSGDAVGLFSSRNTTTTALMTLSQESVEALENSPITASLHFTIP